MPTDSNWESAGKCTSETFVYEKPFAPISLTVAGNVTEVTQLGKLEVKNETRVIVLPSSDAGSVMELSEP